MQAPKQCAQGVPDSCLIAYHDLKLRWFARGLVVSLWLKSEWAQGEGPAAQYSPCGLGQVARHLCRGLLPGVVRVSRDVRGSTELGLHYRQLYFYSFKLHFSCVAEMGMVGIVLFRRF